MNTGKCFFTGEPCSIKEDHSRDVLILDSVACGKYFVSSELYYDYRDTHFKDIQQGNLNCARKNIEIGKLKKKTQPIWVKQENAEYIQSVFDREIINYPHSIYKIALPFEEYFFEPTDHSKKPYDLLQALAERAVEQKAFAKLKVSSRDSAWARIVDDDELNIVLKYLQEKQFILWDFPSQTHIRDSTVQISIAGWEFIRQENFGKKSNKVFIATAFSWSEHDEVRIKAIEAIKEACNELGYEADIVTQSHTGNITDKIISQIKNSNFIVAELTYNNRGVYYEAGLARGFGKQVFTVARNGFTSNKPEDDLTGRKIHFDIAQMIYRTWNTPEDLKITLRDWIDSCVGKF